MYQTNPFYVFLLIAYLYRLLLMLKAPNCFARLLLHLLGSLLLLLIFIIVMFGNSTYLSRSVTSPYPLLILVNQYFVISTGFRNTVSNISFN